MSSLNPAEPRHYLNSTSLQDDKSHEAGYVRRYVPHSPLWRRVRNVCHHAPFAPRSANAAHQNGWEAFAMFSVAVLAAHVSGVDKEWAAKMALLHVLFRLGFNIVYLFGVRATAAVCVVFCVSMSHGGGCCREPVSCDYEMHVNVLVVFSVSVDVCIGVRISLCVCLATCACARVAAVSVCASVLFY